MNWPPGAGGGGGAEFYRTGMGQRFYSKTMPDAVRQLTRLNDLLERALALLEHQTTAPAPGASDEKKEE
jgi:hypothetical protein